MAASTSRSKEPHNVPLPLSPEKTKKDKGKGKDQQRTAQKRRPGGTTSSPDLVWDWISLTAPSSSKARPLFTRDGNYFFSLVGSAVKIHSAATAQVVSTLIADAIVGREDLSNTLTCAILNPTNAYQLITGSMDGCLRIWDFLDATLLRTIDLTHPILHLCAHGSIQDSVFVIVARPHKNGDTTKEDTGVALRVSLTKNDSTSSSSVPHKPTSVEAIGKTRSPTGFGLSPTGTHLVVAAGHKVYVARTSSLKSGFTKYVSPERLTCLAFHPAEDYFATGDDKGVVRLWYCLNADLVVTAVGVEKKSQTSSFHWHAHAVSSLAFASNGAYLLSGGEESVLVVWQLQTGKREFVPRLGAPVKSITHCNTQASGEEYLVELADATRLFIHPATLKVTRSYSQIKLDPTSPTLQRLPAPITVHANTSTLILPSSHPSSLQIYSPSSSKVISELEVSPSNRVSRRDEQPHEPARIHSALISANGIWMATLDVRAGDDSVKSEIYLKFWKWEQSAEQWILNTRIDRPHGLERVLHSAFSSDSSTFVSTGADGQIKIWGLQFTNSEHSEFWSSRSIFSFRTEIPIHASWSNDDSLLVVTFGSFVVLYDPKTTSLIRMITIPDGQYAMSAHLVGRANRFLAVIGNKVLTTWDLVSQTIKCQYDCGTSIYGLLPHPKLDSFVILCSPSPPTQRQTRVCIFQTSSPNPTRLLSLPFDVKNVSLCVSASSLQFAAITGDWTAVMFGDGVTETNHDEAHSLTGVATARRRTLFHDIFGRSSLPEPVQQHDTMASSSSLPRMTGAHSVFDATPTHLLPPMEEMFDAFLDPLVKPDSLSNPSPGEDAENQDEDVEMADASDEPPSTQPSKATNLVSVDIEALALLFQSYSIKPGTSRPLAIRNIVNCTPKTPRVNVVHPQKIPITPAPQHPITFTAPSPVMNGKKRKKP